MRTSSNLLYINFLFDDKKILFFLYSFLLSFFLNCIAIRVYISEKGTDAFDIGNVDTIPHFEIPNLNPHFEVIESPETSRFLFATRDPSLFFLAPRKLENEYGSVKTLIQRELDRNRDDYKTDRRFKIHIKNFELKTIDRCFYGSTTSVKLEIDVNRVEKDEKNLDFRFEDSIDSNVTDCNFALATGTIVGWLIYMPYLGFRGNREDQLNQLGRIALLDFSEKLKSYVEKSSFEKSEKKVRISHP
ncbi:hypothetical protein [Leptospira stimsonii]|uniref:Uncharacterized protein n=1 Tax=Leptospira stimsonii TaxID=2202203 RepID=A0A396Z7N5_9LEPT|nr:hypothetical protein [Leptospira stimsonii]RHX90143.1 hypothetical protein DLM75_13965 [Leptospira stimsonii]